MVARRQSEPKERVTRGRPATTPEARENQLIARAVDLAEQQLLDGTASAQVITHFLKLGSTREQLEQDRLRQENELMKAKIEQMASSSRMEELYEKAIKAMVTYSGGADPDQPEFRDD